MMRGFGTTTGADAVGTVGVLGAAPPDEGLRCVWVGAVLAVATTGRPVIAAVVVRLEPHPTASVRPMRATASGGDGALM